MEDAEDVEELAEQPPLERGGGGSTIGSSGSHIMVPD